MKPRCIQPLSRALAAGILWALASPMAAVGGGTVVGWGDNRFGESTPAASNVVAISAGYEQSLLLIDGGTVADIGEFVGGSYVPTSVPPELDDVVAVAASAAYSLALKADGTVAEWGLPGQDEVPSGLTNVAAIVTTWGQNLALRTDGTVVAWGESGNVPFDLSNVVAIAAGIPSPTLYPPPLNLALKPDGTVLAWDYTGSYAQVPPTWTNIVSISGGFGELLASKADGTVVAWWPGDTLGDPSISANLTNVVAISASSGNDNHISLALLADGNVVGWGYNFFGGPEVPPGLSNVVAVAAGNGLDLALIGGGPPFLTTRLVNRTAPITSTVYFRGEATGAWPLSYRWQFNGTNLPGATAPVLSLTNFQPGQAGAYSVTVSNAYGTVTSDPCLLSVGPAVIRAPAEPNRLPWGSATFYVEAQGRGP